MARIFFRLTGCGILWAGTVGAYTHAIVRGLSPQFENSLKQNLPEIPIDVELAYHQHQAYVQLIQSLVPNVISIDGEAQFPDSNFVEDTAVFLGNLVIITRPGAPERQGEEAAIEREIQGLGIPTIRIAAPGTLDGGDAMFTGHHLFVGLSKRTNEAAIEQLKTQVGNDTLVVAIPVHKGLHLKSVVSYFGNDILVVADTPEGLAIQSAIEATTDRYQFVSVPDPVASNIVRIADTLMIQNGFPKSEKILRELAAEHHVKVVALDMSELIKADGALTCGSLLFNLERL